MRQIKEEKEHPIDILMRELIIIIKMTTNK